MFCMNATPAQFTPTGGYTCMIPDPNAILRRVEAASLPAMKHELDKFVADLPKDASFIVSGHWRGSLPAPRGYKAAYGRNEFSRRVNRS